jgi:hypothetical protein
VETTEAPALWLAGHPSEGSLACALIGLIKLSCFEPDAATRVRAAMSLIEHEWDVTAGSTGRRIFVEISDKVIR